MVRSRKARRMNARSQRGSGILLAMIVVMIVTVVAIGALRFSSRELAGADAGRKHEALVACADAARQLLMSEFRLAGISPLDLRPLNVQLDGGGNTFARSGHIGDSLTVAGVEPAGAMAFPQANSGDITNWLGLGGASSGSGALGQGQAYKIIARCVDHGRELEVEFAVRFGL